MKNRHRRALPVLLLPLLWLACGGETPNRGDGDAGCDGSTYSNTCAGGRVVSICCPPGAHCELPGCGEEVSDSGLDGG